jgi:hypothetical protein
LDATSTTRPISTAQDSAESEAMVCTLDRPGIEKAMGEAWVARFLKWSKRSAHVKTTARTGGVRLAA